MIGDIRKDLNEELADHLIHSSHPKGWRIWTKDGEKPPLDEENYLALSMRFDEIPEIKVGALELFERNDTTRTTRAKISFGAVSLPALELRFQDSKNPEVTYVGFIEGRENINKFLGVFIKKYNEVDPLVSGISRPGISWGMK